VQSLVSVIRAEPAAGGAVLVDESGRRQPLAAAYRSHRLARAISTLGAARGAAMRDVVDRLTLVEVPSDPGLILDCDTWADVAVVRERLEER
jgi:molybdopterin-guanine dinucleotide biosynthesis protein A